MTTLSTSRLGFRFFHRVLFSAACALPLFQIGCGSEAAGERELDPEEILSEAPAIENKDGSLASLGFDTALRSASGGMMYLSGHVPAAITSAAQVRDFVVGKLAAAYQLALGTDFTVISDQIDGSGQRFVRLQQTASGQAVPQGQLTVHVAPDGAVVAVLGQLVAQAVAQSMAGSDGERMVRSALGPQAAGGELSVHGSVEPTIFVPRSGSPQAAFRATVEYVSRHDGERILEVVYVRRSDGSVLARYSQIHDALSRQVYDLGRACIQSGRELPGRSLLSEGGSSSDASASAAYQGLGDTYAFFKSLFGRDSYDGRGSKLVASVHATFAGGSSGCSPNNAVWMGAPYNQMAYGDGDGRVLTDLAKALDVTGHEVAHAVTGSTSGLVYQDESGALNEAMSDIHGVGVLAWKRAGSQAQPPANGASRFQIDEHTWRVGEAAAGASLAGGALRFMNNPTQDGYSRDFYPERIPAGGEDHGGVHGNSGIANLAFYLLSQGGQHPRKRTTTTVNAIGFEKALRIFYTANTTLLDAHATFQSARMATAQAAQSLYGTCSAEWQNTHRAWDAVGVPGAWTPCAAQGGGQPGGSTMPAPGTPIPEVKPNHSFQTAMAIAQSGTVVSGQLASLSDNGFFKMTLAAGATLSLRLDVPAKADYDLYVYNSNGTLIAKSENGLGLAELVSVRNTSSAAFTRYIRVVPYEGTLGAQSPYTLRLSW
ncbi:MAG: M4 family metallopeptidase [Myxococcales bacterium]|nr:M4 family metallopeptidase [Myxococcales bacterium]